MVLSMALQSGREPLRAGTIELDCTVGDEDGVLVTPRGDAMETGDCGNTVVGECGNTVAGDCGDTAMGDCGDTVATSGLTTTCFCDLPLMLDLFSSAMHAAMVFGGCPSFCVVALGVIREGVHFLTVGTRAGICGGCTGFDATGRPHAGDGTVGGGWRGSAGLGLGW